MKISIDQNQLGDVQVMLKSLTLDGPKILSRALNKTATYGKKRASQEIRKQVRLKAAYVNDPKNLNVIKSTWTKLTAKITANPRGLLMTHFPHTALKRGGVTVGIKAGGGRKKMPKAFKTTVRAGSKRVEVIALPAAGKYKTGNRRMRVLYGPSVSQVFNKTRDMIDGELVEYLQAETDKQVETALRGY